MEARAGACAWKGVSLGTYPSIFCTKDIKTSNVPLLA